MRRPAPPSISSRIFFRKRSAASGSVLDPIMHEVVRTRGTAGVLGAIAFIWFSTRLFGSMRSVLLHVFEVPQGHGIFWGSCSTSC